jgi:oligopeptide transport system substrate-binding protein
MKRIFAGMVAAALLLGLAACGKKDDGAGKAFTFPVEAAPVHLDPAIAQSASERLVVQNCFEGLVRLAADAKTGETRLLPGVAERWTVSPDGLTYTFYLRRNTHWNLIPDASDVLGGKDKREAFETHVTADDFVFGLQRALSPATMSPGAAGLYAIANAWQVHDGQLPAEQLGVHAINPFTLAITLARQSDMFLYALTQNAAMPCNRAYFEATGGRYGLGAKYLLCNGPFYVSMMDVGSLRMRANEGYAGQGPVLPKMVDLKLPKDMAAVAQLVGADGGYDAALLPPALPADILESHASKLLQSGTLALLFNCAENAPLSRTNLRVALCAALDSALLLQNLNFQARQGLLPGNLRVGGQTLESLAKAQPGIAHSPERARKLLLGMKEDLPPLVLIYTAAHEQLMARALQLWQSLFGLRLNARMEPLEPAAFEQRLRRGDYDIAIGALPLGSSFALQALQEIAAPGQNPMRYHSNTLDRLLQAAAQMGDAAEAARACRQAEAHLLQNGAVYPLAAQFSRLLRAPGVEGIATSPAGDQLLFAGLKK